MLSGSEGLMLESIQPLQLGRKRTNRYASCGSRSCGFHRSGMRPSRCAMNSSCKTDPFSLMYTVWIANEGTSAIITRRSALATEISVPDSVNLTFSSRSFVSASAGVLAGTLLPLAIVNEKCNNGVEHRVPRCVFALSPQKRRRTTRPEIEVHATDMAICARFRRKADILMRNWKSVPSYQHMWVVFRFLRSFPFSAF